MGAEWGLRTGRRRWRVGLLDGRFEAVDMIQGCGLFGGLGWLFEGVWGRCESGVAVIKWGGSRRSGVCVANASFEVGTAWWFMADVEVAGGDAGGVVSRVDGWGDSQPFLRTSRGG